MQLNLTDYEAQLLEQRLRGRTISFSDADYLAITAIADRLLAREVGTDVTKHGDYDVWTPVFLPWHGDTPVTITFPSTAPIRKLNHTHRRETDEYACSCGARWDVSDVDGHP